MAKSGNIMNLDQEFHSFGVSETLRRQAVLVHNHRTGMALDVLARESETASRLRLAGMHIGLARAVKTKALIEHDRILRGEA